MVGAIRKMVSVKWSVKLLNHRHNDDIVGARVFPTSSAGSGKLAVDRVTGIPDSYRCIQCGFGCVVANGIISPGTANQGDGFQTNDATTGDPIGGRPGCPFCTTGNSKN